MGQLLVLLVKKKIVERIARDFSSQVSFLLPTLVTVQVRTVVYLAMD